MEDKDSLGLSSNWAKFSSSSKSQPWRWEAQRGPGLRDKPEMNANRQIHLRGNAMQNELGVNFKEEFNIGMDLNGFDHENVVNMNTKSRGGLMGMEEFPSLQSNYEKKCKIPNCYKASVQDFCSPLCRQIFERIMSQGVSGQMYQSSADFQISHKSDVEMLHQFGSISEMKSNSGLVSNLNLIEFGSEYQNDRFNFLNPRKASMVKNKFFELSQSKLVARL